jgi:hypothetical protein
LLSPTKKKHGRATVKTVIAAHAAIVAAVLADVVVQSFRVTHCTAGKIEFSALLKGVLLFAVFVFFIALYIVFGVVFFFLDNIVFSDWLHEFYEIAKQRERVFGLGPLSLWILLLERREKAVLARTVVDLKLSPAHKVFFEVLRL